MSIEIEAAQNNPDDDENDGTAASSTAQDDFGVKQLWKISWTEAAGGAAAAAIADSVLYSVDSAKVRAQSPPTTTTAGGDVRILFRGLGPTVLLGSVPVFGSFFFLYAPLKTQLQYHNCDAFLPLASGLCAVPATIIGVPADVLKKRLVLGIDPNITTAIRNVVAHDGIYRGLFAGWHVNLIRDIPFAGVKIGLYEYAQLLYMEYIHKGSKHDKISATGASLCGVASGVACAIITAPLDVVNTRIKADSTTSHSTSIRIVAQEIVQREGIAALFRGVVMRSFVLGIGSSIFWPIQRSVAHSLQQED